MAKFDWRRHDTATFGRRGHHCLWYYVAARFQLTRYALSLQMPTTTVLYHNQNIPSKFFTLQFLMCRDQPEILPERRYLVRLSCRDSSKYSNTFIILNDSIKNLYFWLVFCWASRRTMHHSSSRYSLRRWGKSHRHQPRILSCSTLRGRQYYYRMMGARHALGLLLLRGRYYDY